jgi:hypothetical protein
MERDASTETMSEDTPSSRKDWCCMLFDSFAGSRLADPTHPKEEREANLTAPAELQTRGRTVAANHEQPSLFAAAATLG